jgi:hypothetical protein
MSFRIDPVGGGASARLLRVKPIPSRREDPTEDHDERRKQQEQDERGASYTPAPERLVDAYGPRAAKPVSVDATPSWVAALLKAR